MRITFACVFMAFPPQHQPSRPLRLPLVSLLPGRGPATEAWNGSTSKSCSSYSESWERNAWDVESYKTLRQSAVGLGCFFFFLGGGTSIALYKTRSLVSRRFGIFVCFVISLVISTHGLHIFLFHRTWGRFFGASWARPQRLSLRKNWSCFSLSLRRQEAYRCADRSRPKEEGASKKQHQNEFNAKSNQKRTKKHHSPYCNQWRATTARRWRRERGHNHHHNPKKKGDVHTTTKCNS